MPNQRSAVAQAQGNLIKIQFILWEPEIFATNMAINELNF